MLEILTKKNMVTVVEEPDELIPNDMKQYISASLYKRAENKRHPKLKKLIERVSTEFILKF